MSDKTLNIALIGYKFMGKAHSQAWQTVPRFFDLDVQPTMKVVCGRDAAAVAKFADRWGWEDSSADWQEAVQRDDVDLVDISAPGHVHCEIAVAAAQAGKHVFCEKPLATDYEQCRQIGAELTDGGPLCMVGFNRRFAPLMQPVKEVLAGRKQAAMIHYRVNAGSLPPDDWVYDEAYAQGRIVGEACHFVDLLRWLIGAEPVRVFAQARGECPSLVRFEDVSATFEFADGSVATLLYTAVGAGGFGKERLEVFADGTAIALDEIGRASCRERV